MFKNIINTVNLKWIFVIRPWLKKYSPLYFNFNIKKCYREWWQVRKIFRRPRWQYCHCANTRLWYRPQISIDFIPMRWKSKWDYYSMEMEPMVYLTLLWWTFTWKLGRNDNYDSYIYWETILTADNYINYEKKHEFIAQSVYDAVKDNTWTDMNKKKIDVYNGLTEYGKHLYHVWRDSRKSKPTSIPTNGDTTVTDHNS